MIEYMIAGMPRSRTAWLSVFMSAGGSPCAHDVLGRGIEVQGGISDTCWPLAPELERIVCIHRDPVEVFESMSKHTEVTSEYIQYHLEYADLMYELDGLHIEYHDINNRLQDIWEHCTDLPYINRDYLIPMNIQNQEVMEIA